MEKETNPKGERKTRRSLAVAMARLHATWRGNHVAMGRWRRGKPPRSFDGGFSGERGSENSLPPFESDVGTPGSNRRKSWKHSTSTSESAKSDEEGADGWSRLEEQVRKSALTAPGTHYHFMGLDHDADNATIRSRYRQLSKLYHPDTAKSNDEDANQMFLRLQEAYSVLSSPQSRNIYDWKVYLDAVQGGADYTDRLYNIARAYRAHGSPSSRAYTNDETPRRQERDPEELVPFAGPAFAALLFDAFAVVVSLLTIAIVLLRERMGSM